MFFQLGIVPLRRVEGSFELDLANWSNFRSSRRLVERYEFVVRELDRTIFSDLAIDVSAVHAGLDLPAICVDPLADLDSLHVVDSWSPQLAQVVSSFFLGEQDSSATLAYLLQDHYRELQVANVKDGQGQSDVSEVTIAFIETIAASVADASLTRSTQSLIERTIVRGSPSLRNIVEEGVGDFDNGLIDDILIRPFHMSVQMLWFWKHRYILDAKLELLEALGGLVDDLLFHSRLGQWSWRHVGSVLPGVKQSAVSGAQCICEKHHDMENIAKSP